MLEFIVYLLELVIDIRSLKVCQAWLNLTFIDGLLDLRKWEYLFFSTDLNLINIQMFKLAINSVGTTLMIN